MKQCPETPRTSMYDSERGLVCPRSHAAEQQLSRREPPANYCWNVVVTAVLAIVPYLSNQLRRYSCVRRKFDGVLDVP